MMTYIDSKYKEHGFNNYSQTICMTYTFDGEYDFTVIFNVSGKLQGKVFTLFTEDKYYYRIL